MGNFECSPGVHAPVGQPIAYTSSNWSACPAAGLRFGSHGCSSLRDPPRALGGTGMHVRNGPDGNTSQHGHQRTVRLGGSGLETTSIGFGCASLFRIHSSKDRRRILESALDAGIRHFDVAPMYGLGLAEGELGRAITRHRGELTIASKVGIVPSSAGRFLGHVQAPARLLLSRMSGAQRKLQVAAPGPASGGLGKILYRSAFDHRRTAKSLDRSLKELGTEYLDLLLLHDPFPGLINPDEAYAFMNRAVASGKVLHWGIAGELEPTRIIARQMPGTVPLLQVRHVPGTRYTGGQWAAPPITFGALAPTLKLVRDYVSASATLRRHWRSEIGADVGEIAVAASLLLRDAFASNPNGTVLYSSTSLTRIVEAAVLARNDPSSDPGLERFRRLIATVSSKVEDVSEC